ncbi:MAG TPA: hypothetical protein PLJ05_00930 [Caldisericia bacterium]|nr:hypothetical protein [Caldisericia bacterium]
MKFDVKHIIFALLISIGWIVLSWIFAQIGGGVGGFLNTILMFIWIFGLLVYAMKDVKGLADGVVTGLIYAIVFAIVTIIFHYIGWGGTFPFMVFTGDYGAFFGWPGWWGDLVGIALFGGMLGWINEQK